MKTKIETPIKETDLIHLPLNHWTLYEVEENDFLRISTVSNKDNQAAFEISNRFYKLIGRHYSPQIK